MCGIPSGVATGEDGWTDVASASQSVGEDTRSGADPRDDCGRPLFTVAVCTFNRAEHLVGAIDGVLSQVFQDFELLIVDDGSTDETPTVCRERAGPKVRYVRRDNGGLSAARNTGIEHSRGRYIIYLDDDDRPSADWLAELAGLLAADSEPEQVGVLSCGCRHVEPSGRVRRERLPRAKPPAFTDSPVPVVMLAGCFAVRREIYQALGGYEESIRTSHQTELALRLFPYCDRHGYRVLSVPKMLIDVEARAIADRPLNQPADLLSSLEFVLRTHHDRMVLDRRQHASFRGVAGVAAAQCGDMRRARHHLRHAARLYPRQWRHVVRLGAAYLPFGQRHWRRHWAG